jgi:hypothetical protein
MTCSHYLGLAQLRTHTPALLATPARMRAHIRQLETSLLAGIEAPARARQSLGGRRS